MNIVSITTVAVLLLASIESAESMGLSNNPQVPKMYLGQPMEGKWDGKPATITCMDPNKPEGKIVQSFYEHHRLPSYSSTVDEQTKEGAMYFGNVVAAPSKFGKQCYVIDSACKYDYIQHVKNLSKKLFKKRASLKKNINQIIADMCFDANENLLMPQHNDVLPIEQTTPRQRMEMNRKFLIQFWISNGSLKVIPPSIVCLTGSRPNSIYDIDPVPPYDSRRSSPSGSRRNSISGTSLPPQ
ncbi:hypothetical protein BDF22DRAFT_745363 [Syncephalis plumigaleata]|nr:hypothetical protein BDF22DRAFT_745363 [Syncephalis plumigaleata]